MSKRVDDAYFLDMLAHAREAQENLAGVSYEQWAGDRNQQIVTSHLLMIVGEAASKVSKETQVSHPEIPWARIISMRNRIIHGYGSVDRDKVWDAAGNWLAPLIASLERILPR
jgi:uncharacterized protein with HEPN domain